DPVAGSAFAIARISIARGGSDAAANPGGGLGEAQPTQVYPALGAEVEPPPTQVVRCEWAARSFRELRQGPAPTSPSDVDDWCTALHDSTEAQVFRDAYRADPAAADRLADALTALPQVGSRFAGFQLTRELGRGAFARVFLAEQAALAGRSVVLKLSTYG